MLIRPRRVEMKIELRLTRKATVTQLFSLIHKGSNCGTTVGMICIGVLFCRSERATPL